MAHTRPRPVLLIAPRKLTGMNARTSRFRMVPYRLLPGVDWPLIVITLLLMTFGVIAIWGAKSDGNGVGPIGGYALRQLVWCGLGLVAMVTFMFLDYRSLRVVVWVAYGVLLLALAGLLIKHHTIKGAASWYDLGFFKLQPSEPGKIIIILALARYLAPRARRFRGLKSTLVPLLIVGAPLLLVLAQPDLGTAVVLVPIAAAMFWVAGLRKWVILLFALAGVVVAVSAYPHLKPHQKARIMTFLNPEADPRGKGYNIIQAKMTLGSGQTFGKGWGRGTQSQFSFLPESHTDFIFPTVGEQFGMAGCALALGLFTLLIGRMVRLADVTQNMYGVLTITGLAAMLCTHIIFNIGMTAGLLPVTGLPLPFFSYGGSFMLTCLAAVGLVLGIGARRGL